MKKASYSFVYGIKTVCCCFFLIKSMENSSMFFIFAMIFAKMAILYLLCFGGLWKQNKIKRYMKRRLTDFVMLLSVVVAMSMVSCNSYKKVPYLQNSRDLDTLVQQAVVYEPVIQPNDMINIVVNSGQEPKAAMAYNLTVSRGNSSNSLTSQPALLDYIVDAKGFVDIPNVGEVYLAGLTISQAEDVILDKIKGAFAVPPVVVVRFVDYKISVLGEVKSPGIYTSQDGKINIFQALSQAGDLTVHGQRENIKIIREEKSGEKKVYEVDLNDASLLTSPLYYLQQNDVVYVTPNKRKAKGSDIGSATSLWFSGTSIAISLISLLFNILN